MKGDRQLTVPQRYEIFALKKAGHSQVAIAGLVGVLPPQFLVSFVGIKVRPVTMLRRLIDTLSSAVFNRVVRTKWTRRAQRLVERKLRQQ